MLYLKVWNKFKGTIIWVLKLIFANWIQSLSLLSISSLGILIFLEYSVFFPVWGFIFVFVSILLNIYFIYNNRRQTKEKKRKEKMENIFGLDWILTSNFFSNFLTSVENMDPNFLHNMIKGPFCPNCKIEVLKTKPVVHPIFKDGIFDHTSTISTPITLNECPECGTKFTNLPFYEVSKLKKGVYKKMQAEEIKKKYKS